MTTWESQPSDLLMWVSMPYRPAHAIPLDGPALLSLRKPDEEGRDYTKRPVSSWPDGLSAMVWISKKPSF